MERAMVFGKYCLLERISVGGMAEVFRAKPLPAHQSDKMLALKRILPHLAEDDEFITMFVDEAKLTVQLEHPNIVETYELGNFQSSYYILMEYIAGEDVLELQKRLRQNRRIMSVAQACYIAGRVARGLHYAHTACNEEGRPFNIIHRDVSPQNVRLTWDGRVKLIDFGIAKAAVQRTKTQVGVLKGKFGYMSPEQVRGEQIDHRSDVFALGTTLWEMLTNRRLFNGENEYETLQMVKHPEIPAPSEKNSKVPREVDDIVMRALAEDRDHRFQSASELADALHGFTEGLRTPYTQDHLAEWMADTFAKELAEERRKRELYRQIKSTDDVRWFNREYAEEPEDEKEVAGESLVHEDEEEQEEPADEIWDPEFAPEEGEEVDPEAFATNHTVVAAGGFDPAKFEDEEDEIISIAEDDLIEVDGEAEHESEAPAPSTGEISRPAQERAAERGRGEGGGTDPGTAPGEATEIGGETKIRAVVAAALVAVVVLTVSVGYLMFFGGSPEAASDAEGAVVVEVSPQPDSKGTILVDGEPRGKTSPAAVGELSTGTHTIEVRYPGFEPVEQKVDLAPGELATVGFELERKGEPKGRIRVRTAEPPGGLRVYIDGERRAEGADLEPLTVAPGRHLVEVVADGKKPWARVVEVGANETAVERVQLSSSAPSLRIATDDSATVRVNGESHGETPASVRNLDPGKLHEVELDQTGSYGGWSSHVGFPELGRRVLSVSFDDPPPEYDERDFGRLTISSGGDWWSVFVDGVPTGLITPIESDEKIPVREGTRTITLRRGNRVHDFEIEIEGGDTTSLVKTLQFEWSESDM